MTSTEYLQRLGVEPRLKNNGKIGLQGVNNLPAENRAAVIEWAKENRDEILKELTRTQKGQKKDTGLKLERMSTCLHGKSCKYLDAPGERRPVCSRVNDSVFDLEACPLKLWAKQRQKIISKAE